MKHYVAIALLLCVSVTFAADCNNPLLTLQETKDRFGEANLLTSPTTSETMPICQHLKGKEVCVKPAGFTALQTWFEKQKTDFVAQGNKYSSQYSSVNLASMDFVGCLETTTYYSTFLMMGIMASFQGSSFTFQTLFQSTP